MENWPGFLKSLLPDTSAFMTTAWAEALQRAEVLQISLIVATFFIAIKSRKILENIQFSGWPAANEFSRKAAWAIVWLVGLLFSRLLLEAANLPIVYIDIAALLATAWIILKAVYALNIKAGYKRFLTLLLLSIPALKITDKLGAVISFLEAASFQLGEVHLSLWSITKAIGIFALLAWVFMASIKMLEGYLTRSGNITPSARTLISKLLNFTSITIAILVAMNMMGIDLTAFAFFGGAFGIGIGFGLRTITSNFISGIMLLMDKSIKPGDVISIGESFGVIEELHSRYVVMRRRDGREMLIPNENLITSEVTNWSFNNRKVRNAVQVGVSYDSDLERVQELLLNIAKEHPRVLESPDPKAFVIEFADSAVIFEVRYWIIDPEAGLGSVRSDLFISIWKAFKEEGIEIPFPQRVLHQLPDAA